MQKIFFSLAIVISIISCSKENNSSVKPQITFRNLSTNEAIAGENQLIGIFFLFQDGDGDISNQAYLVESRSPNDTFTYIIPNVPEKISAKNGIKGTMQIDIEGGTLLLRNDSIHVNTDTLHWSIFIKDKKGNSSNVIQTDELILVK